MDLALIELRFPSAMLYIKNSRSLYFIAPALILIDSKQSLSHRLYVYTSSSGLLPLIGVED